MNKILKTFFVSIIIQNAYGATALTQDAPITQLTSAEVSPYKKGIFDSITFGIGTDYAILPLSIRNHINQEPGFFFVLGIIYKSFSYDAYCSMAWPRSKGAFDHDGFLWPENSTSFIVDISGNLGYSFWLWPKFQVKPTVGLGNTRAGLWGKHEQIRFTTLNIPVALNLTYLFDHEGSMPVIHAYSRIRYALFFRTSYAYWPSITPQQLIDNGVWHASLGITISFVPPQP